MIQKNLYTLSETAKILGLSLVTIRRWSADGRLPTIKFSKRTIRVTHKVIESIINGNFSIRFMQELPNV